VVATLSRHGFAADVVVAGALHDAIEDAGITRDDIAARFGEHVAELVVACSEADKSLPWEARKQAYLEAFPKKPWDAQAITLADKIDNLESLLVCRADHGDPWAQLKTWTRGPARAVLRPRARRAVPRAAPPRRRVLRGARRGRTICLRLRKYSSFRRQTSTSSASSARSMMKRKRACGVLAHELVDDAVGREAVGDVDPQHAAGLAGSASCPRASSASSRRGP
jgi:hypothetical protein